MLKKLNYFLLIISFLFLISCGSNKKEEDNNVIKVYSWLSNQKELDLKIAEAYEKETGKKVEFNYIGDMKTSEYFQKIDLMTLGNENMDVVLSPAYPEYAQRAESNAYYDITDFIKEEGINYDDVYSIPAEVNGRIYALPGDFKFWFVLINEDMLKEANLETPSLDWTWDDFYDYAKKMTKGEGVNKVYGAYFHVWDHFNYMGLFSTKENNAILKTRTETNFDDPNLKAWLEFRYKMEKDGILVPYNELKATNATYRDQFFNGKAAMIPIGTWMIQEIGDQTKFPHEFKTTFAPLPKFKDGKEGSTLVEAHYYAVSKNSKKPKEAYDFIRYYTTKGMEIKKNSITAVKGANKMEYVKDMIIGDQKYYNVEALEKVVNNPKFYPNANTIAPSYQKELTDVVVEESEKYYLDQIGVDEALKNMTERANKIIEKNK